MGKYVSINSVFDSFIDPATRKDVRTFHVSIVGNQLVSYRHERVLTREELIKRYGPDVSDHPDSENSYHFKHPEYKGPFVFAVELPNGMFLCNGDLPPSPQSSPNIEKSHPVFVSLSNYQERTFRQFAKSPRIAFSCLREAGITDPSIIEIIDYTPDTSHLFIANPRGDGEENVCSMAQEVIARRKAGEKVGLFIKQPQDDSFFRIHTSYRISEKDYTELVAAGAEFSIISFEEAKTYFANLGVSVDVNVTRPNYREYDTVTETSYDRLIGYTAHTMGTVVFSYRDEDRGMTRYFISSMDEGSYFLSELAEPVTSIREAYNALMPSEVQFMLEAGYNLEDIKRQGEWFFVPLEDPEHTLAALIEDAELEYDSLPHRAGSALHCCNLAYGHGRQIVCSGTVVHRRWEALDRTVKENRNPEFYRSAIVTLDEEGYVDQVLTTTREHRDLLLDATRWSDAPTYHLAYENRAVESWSAQGRGVD